MTDIFRQDQEQPHVPPLNIAVVSALSHRRRRIHDLLLDLQHAGGIEETRRRPCQIALYDRPSIALPIILAQSTNLVITDSRFNWHLPWSMDGITDVIQVLRSQCFSGRIFCLGMYVGSYRSEFTLAKASGADGFIEEDFIDDDCTIQYFIDGIRTVLERPPYKYFAGIDHPVTLL